MVSKKIAGGLKHVWRHQPHTYLWYGSKRIDYWFAWKIPKLSMYQQTHFLIT